jgi:hypothetical protein
MGANHMEIKLVRRSRSRGPWNRISARNGQLERSRGNVLTTQGCENHPSDCLCEEGRDRIAYLALSISPRSGDERSRWK